MDEPSNQTLAVMIGDLREVVGRIEKQVMTTNGRVTKLEQGKWMLYGGWAVASAFFIPIGVSFILGHFKP